MDMYQEFAVGLAASTSLGVGTTDSGAIHNPIDARVLFDALCQVQCECCEYIRRFSQCGKTPGK